MPTARRAHDFAASIDMNIEAFPSGDSDHLVHSMVSSALLRFGEWVRED